MRSLMCSLVADMTDMRSLLGSLFRIHSGRSVGNETVSNMIYASTALAYLLAELA